MKLLGWILLARFISLGCAGVAGFSIIIMGIRALFMGIVRVMAGLIIRLPSKLLSNS
jgi:hypothetical protein